MNDTLILIYLVFFVMLFASTFAFMWRMMSSTLSEMDKKPVKNSWKLGEEGGLSGVPLREKTNKIIRSAYELTNGKITIIGVGGISTGKDAFEKISMGASLLQLYTSLIYQGPNVVVRILSDLSCSLKRKGLKNVSDLIGTNINYD